MHAGRLKKVGSSEGPFASVYFEDVRNREDSRERFEQEWRSMRSQLSKQEAPASLIEQFDSVKDNHHGISGRAGRAIIVTPDAVLVDDILLEPTTSTIVTVGSLPYLIPLIAHGHDTEPFIIAKVDHTGADLCVRDSRGRDVYGESVDGDGFPVHKARVGGPDRYIDTQSLAEENVRKNLTQAATRTATLAREHNVQLVVIIGEVQSRNAFAQHLPSSLRAVEIERGSRAAGSSPTEVAKEIRELIDTERLRRMDVETERFVAEQGRDSDLSVDGTARVLDALEQGKVETLLFTDPDDKEVSSDSLFAPADRLLPYLAIRTGAELVQIDERLTLADGYGAILRHI
ncbi:hypothetical protein B2J88_09330 [Rhodococcus sp. SRB_17]|uniref:baeRF2 domain-containing protein n=1 Tax=Rhodococcus sp. OK302 TaxID=1882769 RepID=UPI000B93B8BE|nr:hypothetical protein [Rhodococcus sp. OK302]NMM84562.1 hypothetical protein [Rhodococcus sp. SRB_17]OYD71895.1 hypothetical protein BDB13_5579 [Rhodococcus sp. OK302]